MKAGLLAGDVAGGLLAVPPDSLLAAGSLEWTALPEPNWPRSRLGVAAVDSVAVAFLRTCCSWWSARLARFQLLAFCVRAELSISVRGGALFLPRLLAGSGQCPDPLVFGVESA